MKPGFRTPSGSYAFLSCRIRGQASPKCCFQRGRSKAISPERYRLPPAAMLASDARLSRALTGSRNSGGMPGRIPNPITYFVLGATKSGTDDVVPLQGHRRTWPPPSRVGGRLERTCWMYWGATFQGRMVSIQGWVFAQ